MTQSEHLRPIFVVGTGRSGTTLVRAMLDAHSAMGIPPETHYVKFTDGYGSATREAPEDFPEFWANLIARRQFLDTGVDPDDVLAKTAETGGRTFRGVFLALLAVYAEQHGKRRPGEKTPGHYKYIDRLFRWYPDAQVIALRRDPRAVVASHLGSPWVTQQIDSRGVAAPLVPRLRLFHVVEHARLWRTAYESYLAKAETDPRVHTVSYEALVEAPEEQVKAMTAFLGEPFEPAMIRDRASVAGSAARDRLKDDRWREWVRDHESKASAPISRDGLEKWRQSLSEVEVEVIEDICGPVMTRLGYRTESRSGGTRRAAWLTQAALGASGAEFRLRHKVDQMRRRLPRREPVPEGSAR